MRCTGRLLARSYPFGMSGILSLLGVNRTWRGQPNSVEMTLKRSCLAATRQPLADAERASHLVPRQEQPAGMNRRASACLRSRYISTYAALFAGAAPSIAPICFSSVSISK
jgi:hypothetical protein